MMENDERLSINSLKSLEDGSLKEQRLPRGYKPAQKYTYQKNALRERCTNARKLGSPKRGFNLAKQARAS